MMATPSWDSSQSERSKRVTRSWVGRSAAAFVAELSDKLDVRSWYLGVEIIAHHDPGWRITPAWAVADWGLQACVVLGLRCPAPVFGRQLPMTICVGPQHDQVSAAWPLPWSEIATFLVQDCPRLYRPAMAGDLIWTGTLAPARPIDDATTLHVDLSEYGALTTPLR
jgi:2-keto-4-pentenoate hydratase